ncbi:hypothetical protein SLE2022_340270 [Rubroshorea leprosula]
MANQLKYSCDSATETLEWIKAIADFIRPYSFLINAHVVNFFKDRLWEAVDKEWIECLRKEPVENLLLIPSGTVQDHWPPSLKEFILTLRSLEFPRESADLKTVIPDLHMKSLNTVLSQGMNQKKKHEVEILSAVVSSVANNVGAATIVDVGAGQGYLAQVLSFQYLHSVIAIDACSHYGKVTDARAERIKKHYESQMRKFGSGNMNLNAPKTITCRVMSMDSLKALTNTFVPENNDEQSRMMAHDCEKADERQVQSLCPPNIGSSLVLAGLHACGDLSVTMLKAFSECREVRAVVSIGCCYNLLSEGSENSGDHCGFPMSCGVKTVSLLLGKSSRDLACQSADRWRNLSKDAGLHNFELHAFRAAFEMVLSKHYPEVMITSPSIGRQGKALRRQQQRRILESQLRQKESTYSHSNVVEHCSVVGHGESGTSDISGLVSNMDTLSIKSEGDLSVDKCSLFEKFSLSGLCRLGLHPLGDINFQGIWKEVEPYAELVGVYWSLRAALGPLLETFILLDRLLFLQEQVNKLEVVMLPIFDPALSPRNVAIIARKVDTTMQP